MTGRLPLVLRYFLTVTCAAMLVLLPVVGSAAVAYSGADSQRTGIDQRDVMRVLHAGEQSGSSVVMAPQTSAALLRTRAVELGPHSDQSPIDLTISLKLRNVAQLKQFLRDVQNPRSPQFHQFLTPAQFTNRYGPTKDQVASVVAFLESKGISVKDVSPNRILIHTWARTELYEHAFGIRINDYKMNDQRFFSTEDSPKLPRAVAGLVQNVIGLNNAVQMRPSIHIRPLESSEGLQPRAAPPPATSAYYNPSQIATSYDWPDITQEANGGGVTLAILTADSSGLESVPDYGYFWDTYGLPDHTVNIIPVDGDEGATDGMGETLLDMEWGGAMGPGAILDVYVASNPSFATFTNMYNQFVTDNSAQVMTTSWGAPESAGPTATDEQIFMQGAAQGISMFAAAGDNGSGDGTGQDNMADYPSVSEYITAANGTELQADIDGNYLDETTWVDTGGAISAAIGQPDWQTGPGVPDSGWRMNSDMAMNAGPDWPYLLRYRGAWYLSWGTSAVAPQFGGLFAIAVSSKGRIGQSNVAIYNDVNAGNYANDFRDITVGSNGAYEAGPDWDHPTGWGSPRAESLISHLGEKGPAGKLVGTVSDASDGDQVSGATVLINPGHYFRTTGADGKFSMVLPAGSYTAEVSAFGYRTYSSAVSVSDGQDTVLNVPLQAAPLRTVSGHVLDGSGHGYGLYARITVSSGNFGQVAEVWTTPATGAYSVSLPDGFDYTLNVHSVLPGYVSQSLSIDSLSADETDDFSLVVSVACTAPGYHFERGFGTDFNEGFPPSGWQVETPVDNQQVVWKSNSAYGDSNYTGGSGEAAEANSDKAGLGQGPYDTRLVTPPIAVTSLPANPQLKFRYQYLKAPTDALDVGISTDGGANWTQILSADNCGSPYELPGCDQLVNLGGYLPGSGSIRLRWRYHDESQNPWNYYVQVDDVRIGKCESIPGGLVIGRVSDSLRDRGLVGASVSDDLGNRAETIENTANSDLPAGSYILFAPMGDRTLAAADWHYQTATDNISMGNNAVVTIDFALNAGRVSVEPNGISTDVSVNGTGSKSFTIRNSGNAVAHYQLLETSLPAVSGASAGVAKLASTSHDSGDMGVFSLHVCAAAKKACTGRNSSGFVPAAAQGTAPGSIVSSFQPDLANVYGLGVNLANDKLWIGSISAGNSGGDNHDHEFDFDGTATGRTVDVSSFSPEGFTGDMAYDYSTGLLWQTGVIGNNKFCIYAIDPKLAMKANREVCPPVNSYEVALAYDPATNSWYAGDYNNDMIYQFDSQGQLIDAADVGIKVIGLTYNPATGHLFAAASVQGRDIFVLDTRDDYKVLRSFDVADMDGGAGAGLGHDCDGHLWVTDLNQNKVYEIQSGETGWCDYQHVGWLSEAPASGSIAPGESVEVRVSIDGAGQEVGTSDTAGVLVRTDTPYGTGTLTVPVDVTWTPASNSAPVADDGEISTVENESVGDVLGASDTDGDALTFLIVGAPSHGTVSIDDAASGAYTYTPSSGYTGNDSFTFKVNDGSLDSNIATVRVTVKAQKPAPSDGGGGTIGWSTIFALWCLTMLMLCVAIRRRSRVARERD